jgi:hypothetical protein
MRKHTLGADTEGEKKRAGLPPLVEPHPPPGLNSSSL